MKDYYKILGVERTASSKEIKDAYFRLTRQYHPDVNPEITALSFFHDVVEAYNILGNLDNRLHYSFIISQNKYNQPKWIRKFNLPVSTHD